MDAMTVAEAFEAVDRADFLPGYLRMDAHIDGPIPIGRGQTNSQPRTVRAMLSLLDVHEGQHVLDVGSGSGWTTALLARLVGSTGSVVGVELKDDLASWGAQNLELQNTPWASIREAEPEVLGAPADGPFDRILVSASARNMPDELVAQLGIGAVMVVPIGATMTRVRRHGPAAGDLEVTAHGSYSFVPLL